MFHDIVSWPLKTLLKTSWRFLTIVQPINNKQVINTTQEWSNTDTEDKIFKGINYLQDWKNNVEDVSNEASKQVMEFKVCKILFLIWTPLKLSWFRRKGYN